MKKILITGGNGFIGLRICRKCREQNIDFLALTERVNPQLSQENLIEVNLLDSLAMEKVVMDYRPDAIIHLAAIASPVHENIAEIYSTNIQGTEILLQCAAKHLPEGTRVVLVSTAGVYGNQGVDYLHEELPFNPVNHYSYSKMVMEFLSRQYADHLQIQIVRPFNIIGTGQKVSFFIPKLIKNFVERSPRLEVGNLDAVRDYISVEYCAEVMLQLALTDRKAAPVLNICTGTGYNCRQVIDLLSRLTGYCPDIVANSNFIRKNEIWHLVGDTKNLMEFTQSAYMSEGLPDILRRMIAEANA